MADFFQKPADLVGTPVTGTAAATTSLVTLPVSANANQMVMINDGTVRANVVFGADNTVVATAAGAAQGYKLLPGTTQTITLSNQMLYAAIISVSATTTEIQFQRAIGS